MTEQDRRRDAERRRQAAELVRVQAEAWAKLTDEQRIVYSDLNFRVSQFELQCYVPEPADVAVGPQRRTKEQALKLTAQLARQWADAVDPPEEK